MNSNEPRMPEHVIKVVTLAGRDLEDARRLLWVLTTGSDLMSPIEANTSAVKRHHPPEPQLVGKARAILKNRQRRLLSFGKGMFGEPAWEMLLLLFISDYGPRLTVSSLLELSGASKSTALRWAMYLESQQLVAREPHPTDRRTAFIRLTAKARDLLEQYLSETIDTLL
jgi:hypothetical protein